MSEPHHPTSVQSSVRLYLLVGAVLFMGTIVTVAVATLPWLDVGGHGFDKADMILGLIIASVKALLVAAVFMHFNHERSLVYFLIGLAGAHAVGMFAFTMLSEIDRVRDPLFYHGTRSTDPGGVSVSRAPFPQTETTPRPRHWIGP